MKFEEFMKQLSTTNSTLDFFVDFKKVSINIEKISIKLNQLNYLIGKDNIHQVIKNLHKENKSIKHLVDYVFGIEVGLDTNTRKNRGGKNMEKTN